MRTLQLEERFDAVMSDVVRCRLRELCGVRSGDKGDISDISLFADDEATS